MTVLYEQVCLKAFPDDKAVEALMTAQNARPLSAEDVKVTMRDDPARAWELKDATATVWIEFPPYHACSVRWNTPDIGDLGQYRSIADRYERATGDFSAIDPYDTDYGDIHVHAVGEQTKLPDGRTESLFIYDQHITDAKRRAAGETGYSLRFVHQYAAPDAN
ncbi:MAG: NMCC_0638 family (lipo)protein [Sphingomicrobium sp.]